MLAGAGIGIVLVVVVRGGLGLPDVISPVALSFTLAGWTFSLGLQDVLIGGSLGMAVGAYGARRARQCTDALDSCEQSKQHFESRLRLYRLVGLSVFSVAFLGGVIAMSVGVRDTWSGWNSLRWPTAAGVVTGSTVTFARWTDTMASQPLTANRTETRTHETWFPAVTYEYAVDGVVLTGRRITIADGGSDYDAATARAAVYPVGAEVSVSYDPEDASQAVLAPGVSTGSVVPIVLGTLWCLCCAVAAKILVLSRFAKQLVLALATPPAIRI